jgi:putative peptidoglycan lipid II flippase
MKSLPVQSISKTWNKLTNGSINRQIFGAALTVGVGTALVKGIAVVKELVVAWKFGTGDALDAFLIALLIPAFIVNVVAGSFNAALIPTYIRVREQEGQNAAQKLFSGVTIWSLALLGIATILMMVTAPLYIPLIASGFSSEKLNLTFNLLYTISPFVLLSGIIAIWSAVLNAGERFILASLSPILTPLISIGVLLAFSSLGSFALAAGLVGGAVLEIFLLGVALHQQHISLRPKWYGFDPHLRQVTGQFIPMLAGSFMMCSAGLVDQSMAAMLSPGSVAALNYGNRVIALPITLATTALSAAVIPYFSKMVAHQDWKSIRHTLQRYLKIIFIVTVPLALVFIVLSEQIVTLLFQRGSFTANDTHVVANIQFYFAFQIPFYVANILVVRLISAMQLNQILMQVSGLNFIINIVLNYVFMQWMGISGIALSTSCVYIFCFLYMFINAKIILRKYS